MITDIRLQNFRLYKDSAFDFNEGVNIIVGPNASGKTSLLEALLVVSRGASYKAQAMELVRFGESWLKLDAHTATETRTVKTVIENAKATRSFEINKNAYKRLTQNHIIPTVLFEPLHLLMLGKRPDLRRDFLDNILEYTHPNFMKLRRDYKRTLAQRNAALKSNRIQQDIFPWNIRLGELGGQIASARKQLTVLIDEQISDLYGVLSGSKTPIKVTYDTSIIGNDYASSLLKRLEATIETDYQRGFTTHGPHRDDLRITLNGKVAQETASRGESRTILLALKMIELRIMENKLNQTPILLLDDVFSELDGARRKSLTKFLENYQTFITTTDADIVLHDFTKKTNVIAVSS